MRKKVDPVIVIVAVLALGIFATAATRAMNNAEEQNVVVPELHRGVYLNNQ
ncbi:MAG TPA: hypothetical protein VLA24_06425 [Pseudomonadales bacterium]|nr:hypothetical protein [Pseudomonadales bacterium]